MKLILLMFAVFICLSCGETNEKQKELKILQSKSITIPNDLKVFVNGLSIVMDSLFDCELKLIVYADSVECSTCLISKLEQWVHLFDYAKIFNNRLKYYFIFAPSKANEHKVAFALKTRRFEHPLILDYNGNFEKLNPHLPKNKAMHTFLLDKDNNVVLVGSPLVNYDTEKLFMETTAELLAD